MMANYNKGNEDGKRGRPTGSLKKFDPERAKQRREIFERMNKEMDKIMAIDPNEMTPGKIIPMNEEELKQAKANMTMLDRSITPDLRSDEWRGANAATVIEGVLALIPIRKKIIILEDIFKSGYECKTCDGSGASKEVCPNCKGKRIESSGEEVIACRACSVGESGLRTSLGYKPCPDCNGRGGLLIAPEKSQRRPTSGVVMSCGPDCKSIRKGDHVLYGNYAGHAITFKHRTTVRIMDEDEVLTLMYKSSYDMNEAEWVAQ